MTIPGSYVKTAQSSNSRVNAIVDVMLSSNLLEFRQIMIHYEPGTVMSHNTYRFSYQNWNDGFIPEVFLDQNPDPLNATNYTVDYLMGTITMNWTPQANDNVMCTYNFDYFPVHILEGFIIKAIDVINTGAEGPSTNYDVTNAPTNWDGIIADLVFAMCMERLLLDYDLWKGRLIFAIGPQQLADGGGDITGQLETLKQNAEERAYKSMENPKLKSPNYLSRPTHHYYDALLVGSGHRGCHGGLAYGKMRGIRLNKYLGKVL